MLGKSNTTPSLAQVQADGARNQQAAQQRNRRLELAAKLTLKLGPSGRQTLAVSLTAEEAREIIAELESGQ